MTVRLARIAAMQVVERPTGNVWHVGTGSIFRGGIPLARLHSCSLARQLGIDAHQLIHAVDLVIVRGQPLARTRQLIIRASIMRCQVFVWHVRMPTGLCARLPLPPQAPPGSILASIGAAHLGAAANLCFTQAWVVGAFARMRVAQKLSRVWVSLTEAQSLPPDDLALAAEGVQQAPTR